MKISTFVSILAVIGIIFFIYGLAVSEMNTQYPSSNISSSDWGNPKYDYSAKINTSVAPIQKAFNDIEDENLGWFTKLTSGITAIPKAVITLPVLVFNTFSMGSSMVTGFLTTLGIPSYIVLVASIMLIIWGLFKLIGAFQRWDI